MAFLVNPADYAFEALVRVMQHRRLFHLSSNPTYSCLRVCEGQTHALPRAAAGLLDSLFDLNTKKKSAKEADALLIIVRAWLVGKRRSNGLPTVPDVSFCSGMPSRTVRNSSNDPAGFGNGIDSNRLRCLQKRAVLRLCLLMASNLTESRCPHNCVCLTHYGLDLCVY
ncbi:hypothetical protein CLAIMM_09144 [Cladophialophora immunda]|nr:hypothetical protein CLAIMM_09144 [Cladophialophora immunda]